MTRLFAAVAFSRKLDLLVFCLGQSTMMLWVQNESVSSLLSKGRYIYTTCQKWLVVKVASPSGLT
jgi:hypothetical protein